MVPQPDPRLGHILPRALKHRYLVRAQSLRQGAVRVGVGAALWMVVVVVQQGSGEVEGVGEGDVDSDAGEGGHEVGGVAEEGGACSGRPSRADGQHEQRSRDESVRRLEGDDALEVVVAVGEVAFRQDLPGQVRLVPVDAAVLDPGLRLADGGVDPDAVVAGPLADQRATVVEHEATAPAGEVRQPRFLGADVRGSQLDHGDARIVRLLVREEGPDFGPGAVGTDDEVEARFRPVCEDEVVLGFRRLGRFDADKASVPLDRPGLDRVQKDVSQLGAVDLGSISRVVVPGSVRVVLIPEHSAIALHQLHRLRGGKGVFVELVKQAGFA